MSGVRPGSAAGSIVTFTITSDGAVIPDEAQVVSITTRMALNQVPRARVVLVDGDAATQDFPMSDSEAFLPGANVEISAGYYGQDSLIFSGVIVRHAVKIDRSHGSRLVIEIADKALAMTLERKNAVFEQMKDSDIISALIEKSGLGASVDATTTVLEQVVQFDATDWDMMMTRAQVNGFVVLVDAGTVTVAAPDTTTPPQLSVTYGVDMMSVDAEMDAPSQLAQSAVKSTAWNVPTQRVVEQSARPVSVTEAGNVTSDDLAEVFDVESFVNQTGAPIEETSLADWATAQLQMAKLAKIRGSVEFPGNSLAKAGDMIELAGIGQRFEGASYVSAVSHDISKGGWTTTCDFGMSPNWFAAETAVATPEAAGLLPPIRGLQTGVVKAVAHVADGELRVQVELPLLRAADAAIWVRLGSFYASKAVGAVFYPEVGDEVIVGFMNDDPRYGVILASVFSATMAPPYLPDDTNRMKAIVTRSQLEVTFDDEDKIIEVKTPAGQSVTLDDTSGEVVVKDMNSNTVTMSSSGIVFDSAADVDIKARENVTIEATGITLRATSEFSASGDGSAELTSFGVCTVTGALVKIN